MVLTSLAGRRPAGAAGRPASAACVAVARVLLLLPLCGLPGMAGRPGSRPVPAQPLAFLLGRPAPHAVDLPGGQREVQAGLLHAAAGADGFRVADLVERRASRRDWEEYVRVC